MYGLTQTIVQPGTTQVFALGDALHRQSNCRFTVQAVVQNPDPFG